MKNGKVYSDTQILFDMINYLHLFFLNHTLVFDQLILSKRANDPVFPTFLWIRRQFEMCISKGIIYLRL